MSKNDVVGGVKRLRHWTWPRAGKFLIYSATTATLVRFLRESWRRVVPRLLFSLDSQGNTFVYDMKRNHGARDGKFCSSTRIWSGGDGCLKVGEIFHDPADSVMCCDPVNFVIRILFNARSRSEAMNGEEVFWNFDEILILFRKWSNRLYSI